MTSEHPYKPGGISCREVVEIVTDYLEGALEAGELTRMEEHLALCPPCQEYVEQVRATAVLAAQAESELVQRPDRDALLASFRDFQRARRTGS